MATKNEAVEVFRQFAWHLAGKIAAPKSGAARPPKPRGKR
jgi:hypothetical protein